MNNGRICISICASTVEKFIDRIESAKGKSDLIELRFDCLEKDELKAENTNNLRPVLAKILAASGDKCISTFRPKEYGGSREISSLERSNFWTLVSKTDFADLEADIVDDGSPAQIICSFHDFNGVPPDLESVFRHLVATGADVVKIAAHVDEATDAVTIWKLFDLASETGRRVIPIAMGEAGKWTRVLGLAYGSPITYASPDDDRRTAPGQISASDMRDIFRVKDLDKQTSVFGLIAGDTSYSFSPQMHNTAFAHAGLNHVFVPLQVRDLDEFMRRVVKHETREIDLNFGGFSVTNPHKQTVMNYLDRIDPSAKAIGAVNTVKIDGDELAGYNTDAPGFIKPLQDALGDLRDARVTVGGAGGAARAVVYALTQDGAEVTVLARDVRKASKLADEFGIKVDQLNTGNRPLTTDILVNCTPLGTKGDNQHKSIATADQLKDVKLVYDLVYNPMETRLISEAKASGVATIGGFDMWIAQGAHQFKIWTGGEAPTAAMRSAVEERLR